MNPPRATAEDDVAFLVATPKEGTAQPNHIGFAIRAFVRLEWHRFTAGVSWFAAKLGIIRETVRGFLANPTFEPLPAPTA